MITDKEREEIILAAVERCYLGVPELIGNLMAHHAALNKINKEFYGQHPEFSKHRDVVQKVVEAVEGANPVADYKDILKNAIPEIRKRIDTLGKLNMDVPATPARSYEPLSSGNGEL